MGFWNCFCVLSYLICMAIAKRHDNTLSISQKLHKAKTLRSGSVKKLALMSDPPEEKSYFRNTLLKPMLIQRVPDTPGNSFVQQHIRDQMSRFSWTLEDDQFTEDTVIGPKTFTNIIATHNPTAPRRLVLACHHDSKLMRGINFVAATDSAVPCALMMDIARLMNETLWRNDHKKVKDVSLQFIFFDGEEAFKQWSKTDSIYGARHLAEKMSKNIVEVEREVFTKEIDTIDLLILLDLIGTRDMSFKNWFSNTESHFERMKKIELRLLKDDLLKVSKHQNKKIANYFTGAYMGGFNTIEDDHKPFVDRGVPVLHMISYPFPIVWHKETDNEHALDFDAINNINKILRVFIAEYLHLSP